ncbi:GNAT family N-acetyltransferase [Mariprofundus sp. NF]|uniref:GNAT family N-acetyltransferase n=1 Tax=Mariprofundus sp. NF TaxID=2608716 RepID=UPI0015A1BB00|nr:GNAT family protein [Mariprofundus sp. NF]NWF37930.1 GNAT family N-acetyltransferase [Mariprofundus sp. NF]
MNTSEEQAVISETDRLYFRGLCKADIDGPYLHWFNDQEVCRFNSHGVFPSTRQRLEEYIDMLQSSGSHLVWAVFLKEDHRHIGNISLQSIDRYNRCAEFAIIMGDRSCWGHGYAEEAARLLCSHGFNKVGLHRIHCGTSENNAGMIALATKLGMKQEGVRRQALFENGSFVDAVEFGLLKGELDPER